MLAAQRSPIQSESPTGMVAGVVPNDPRSHEIHQCGTAPTDETLAMMVWLTIVGLFVLIAIAIGIGAALDTEAQRRQSRRLAAERRARIIGDRRVPLCDDCPLRDLD